ncbi:KaiC domain-containing protein [Halobellus sp. GM3]|uniref:KaiC domain-containing protein n=1 Tax=Halobellus sp. GM3 TaxID=3458410 RepID=UPI00403D82FD
MSDDDDWFERALREDESESDGDESESDGDGESRSEAAEAAAAADEQRAGDKTQPEAADTQPEADSERTEDSARGDGTTAEDDDADDDGTVAWTDASDPNRDGDGAGEPSGVAGDDADDPFGEDFATALENAPDPEIPGSSDTDRPEDIERVVPTGGGSAAPGRAGGAPADASGGDGGEFGFADFESETESFDEEEFESNLDRLDIGIEGLDDMILGGVPKRSLMVTIGSAGTGKTTFGLQFLHHGLENGENAVFITLEESYDRIISTADEKDWGFESHVEAGRLAIVDIDPTEMANSLDSIQNDLPKLIDSFGADRLVLDSVSLLEMMYDRSSKRRSQVFEFTRALKNVGVTTLMTSEASEDNPYASRFGIVEYLADAVFVLQYVRPSDFRETRLAIEIQKIRDANHSRETKPYELTADGISVYRQATIF